MLEKTLLDRIVAFIAVTIFLLVFTFLHIFYLVSVPARVAVRAGTCLKKSTAPSSLCLRGHHGFCGVEKVASVLVAHPILLLYPTRLHFVRRVAMNTKTFIITMPMIPQLATPSDTDSIPLRNKLYHVLGSNPLSMMREGLSEE